MESVEEKVLSKEVVTELLSQVIIKEQVIDPTYEISSGSAKGDGYTSFMTKVNVKGRNKVLPLIIKSAPKNVNMRNAFPIRVAFLQEIKYYNEVLPIFKKFQHERKVKKPFDSAPLCYKTDDSENGELLILENIKEKGFEVFDKRKQMDEDHVKMVLRAYGEFHAISFSMKDHAMGRFEELTRNIDNTFSMVHFKEDFFGMFLDGADKIKSVFDQTTEAGVYNLFSNLKGSIMPFFKSIEKYKGKYGVLTHGDCWCNNMMFKYEGKKSTPPVGIRLFDFQLGSLSTPVMDLSYFFYATASQNMLDNLEYYLQFYHDCLRFHMLEMGSNVEIFYPYSALKEEWKVYGKFGLFLAMPIYRIMLRDDDEIIDFTDGMSSTKDTFMNSSKYDDLINEKYRRIGLHFYHNKFI